VKKGWERRRLGEVCDVVNGGTPKTSVTEYWNGKHLWITPAEMGKRLSPYVNDTERKISNLGLRDSSAQMLPPYSVILSSRAPIGHLVVNTKPMSTNQGCKGLIPGKQLEHKFLYYYLSSVVDLLNSLGTGATFKELSGGKLKEVEIPLPPLAEQHRIAGLLDEAFAGLATAKANAEKNLQNARAVFESHLNDVFSQRGEGWVEKRLERLASIRTGKRDANHQVHDGPYPFYTCAFGQFKSPTYSFDGPSIILPGNGANVGKVFFYKGKFEAYQRTYVVNELNHAINARFLYFCFSANWSSWIANKQFGSATNYIVVGDLKAFPVPVPCLPVQVATVEQLESYATETQRLADLYSRKCAALEALKKSLLHQAFSGEL
jgi:type I restriction enzyme, S subunit